MLDRIYLCLSDPTRRAIIARLAREDGLTVKDLAKPFDMSLPAVIKHIDLLCAAGLLERERAGRFVRCHVRPEALRAAQDWLDAHLAFWEPRLDKLKHAAEARAKQEDPDEA
jgi:DNA-binding transcriptional ArsR family regulator